MTTEEKFNAAVNVIRSLPKNGSYQPSTDLMLRFYAYYKQATEGPCKGSRPRFWDVVGRAKYDAWKNLGDMSRATAMSKYVDELHSIVETMSYSEKVANFLEAPTNELDSINMDDLELVAGDIIERVRSQPNSPLGSREASPCRFISNLSSSRSRTPSPPLEESDHSEDEYTDTIEAPDPKFNTPNGDISSHYTTIQKEHVSRSRTKPQSSVDISAEISKTVQSLKNDIDCLSNRILVLETKNNQKSVVEKRGSFFGGLSTQLFAFIILWPFAVNLIVGKLLARRK